MSSSGQAPNVSMDDLLASIKSMIEGESSGEANSQVESHVPAAGMNPGGGDMQGGTPPSDALDDGIMDLTQVVSQPVVTDPSAGNPLLSDPSTNDGFNPAMQPEVPADDMQAAGLAASPDMGGPAAISQEAPLSQDAGFQDAGGFNPLAQNQAPQNQAHQGQVPQNQVSQNQVNQGQAGEMPAMQAPAVMDGQQAGQAAQDTAAQLDNIFSGMGADKDSGGFSNMGGDIGLPAGEATGQGPDPMGQAAPNMMQNDSPVQPLSGQMRGLTNGGEQPVVPLDQGSPQFSGANGGQMTPESGVPHPGFQSGFEGQGAPLGQEGLAQQQEHGQFSQEQNQVQSQQNQGQNLGQLQGQERIESLGGHDPRLENEIAMEQALNQADASLNLSNSHLNTPQMNQQPQMQQQVPMQQQAHMRGMQPNMQPMPGQHPGQHPGQAPIQQGFGQQGHMPQGQLPQPISQQGQMHQGQMHQGQMVAQGGGDMLPVPSGFRPVLPAVQEQAPMAMNPMGDQLPVEMKNNLEEIVKQLLKPLLREWLERNLPELLKGVVDEETGKIDPNKW